MKSKLLYVVFSIAIGSSFISANQIKEDFKQALYNKQRGLMDQADYNKLIDPYLQEAEKSLKAIQYCIKNPQSDVCKVYFHRLLDFNVSTFYIHCYPNSKDANVNFNYEEALLKSAIENIKNESKQNFSVSEEYEATAKLFKDANAEYCKNLRFGNKF